MIISLTQQQTELTETLTELKAVGVSFCDVGIICGSGISDIVKEFGLPKVDFSTKLLPHWPSTTVEGHYGRWQYFALKNGLLLSIIQGRGHLYEGNDPYRATYPIRVLGELGCKLVIITSACGSLNPEFKPNSVMLHKDFINFTNANPLCGVEIPQGQPRFPDMTHPYDEELTKQLGQILSEYKIIVNYGTHVQVLGPSFETKAEILMLSRLGGDVVSMSSAIEVIVAHTIGIKVIGISVITNYGTGLGILEHQHDTVLYRAKNVSVKLGKGLKRFLESIKI